MKKIGLLFLISILLFSSIVCAYGSTAIGVQEMLINMEYTMVVMERTGNYEKIEITNNKTGKIEYVESFLNGDQTKYIVTTGEDKYVISKNNEEKIIINKNGALFQEIRVSENINEISTRGYGDWTPWTTTNVNMNIAGMGVGVLAATLGFLLVGPGVASLFYNIASVAVAGGITFLYITTQHRMRINWDISTYQEERNIYIYLTPEKDKVWKSLFLSFENPLD